MEFSRVSKETTLRLAVLRGEPAAWRALYDEAFTPVYRFVSFRTGRDEERAEDVLQEVWLIAVRKIRRFDPQRCSFEGWLKTIAVNVVRNHRRKWRKLAGQAGEPSEGAERAAGRSGASIELAEQIALAMTDLPSAYQSVLRERYQEHLSVAEIASNRGTTNKAAESLLARARTAFRAAYSRVDGEST
jgi:RNA polymerase sigma-70 factor (ECF subfamily)